jgi:hypothetical protein
MFDFKKSVINRTYKLVKNGAVDEEKMFSTAEAILQRPLKETQKQFIIDVANRIKNNEMTLEEFSALVDQKLGLSHDRHN